MAEIRRVRISEDHLIKVQRLDYEIGGHLTLLRSMMRESKYPYTSEHYEHFMKNYSLLTAEYNLFLLELKSFYAPDIKEDVSIVIDVTSEEIVLSSSSTSTHNHNHGPRMGNHHHGHTDAVQKPEVLIEKD